MAANLMFDAFICVGTFFFINSVSGNFGAPGQPRQQLRRSRSTSPKTWALPVNLASNFAALLASDFAAPSKTRQQLRRSRSTLAATSALLVILAGNIGAPGNLASNFCDPGNLASNFRAPRNLASNFGALQQVGRSRLTSPATSARSVNLASNFSALCQPHQQLRRSRLPFFSFLV